MLVFAAQNEETGSYKITQESSCKTGWMPAAAFKGAARQIFSFLFNVLWILSHERFQHLPTHTFFFYFLYLFLWKWPLHLHLTEFDFSQNTNGGFKWPSRWSAFSCILFLLTQTVEEHTARGLKMEKGVR